MFHVPSLLLSITVVAVAAMLLQSTIKRLVVDRTQRLNDKREFINGTGHVPGQPVMPSCRIESQAAAL